MFLLVVIAQSGVTVTALDIFQTGVTPIRWRTWFMETGQIRSHPYATRAVLANTLLPSAMSTFSPVSSRSSNGMCVWTEWTWSMHYAGISTYQFISYSASAIHKHMPTRILKPSEDGEPTGLKVDIALPSLYSTHTAIGQFSEAGLHEWMPFVIFCAKSCSITSRLISE